MSQLHLIAQLEAADSSGSTAFDRWLANFDPSTAVVIISSHRSSF